MTTEKMTENKDVLFDSFQLNNQITLKNRILMAPLTRCMADDNLVPTEAMAAYYARRADAGLIISEATIIRPDGQGYPNTPGIFNDQQVEGWQKVTARVHNSGGLMFAQLWHTGRVAHSHFSGQQPIAPSALQAEGSVPRMRELTYETPKAATEDDLIQLVEDYKQAAINAVKKAKFDGIEIHGANGYLLDQFLHYDTNQRDDEFGGNPENMSRFVLQVIDAIVDAIGAERTAIRLSPGAYVHLSGDSRDKEVFDYLLAQLEKRGLAYVHLGIFDDSMTFDYLQGTASAYLREAYKGTLVGVGGYSAQTAAEGIKNNAFDLIAIGRPFIANPDYVSKTKSGQPLREYDESMLMELI